MSTERPADSFRSYRQIVVIVVVGLGYALALADEFHDGEFSLTAVETVAVIVVGLIFLILNLNEERLLDERPARWKVPVYFIVQLSLYTISVLILDVVNGVWLVAMPLVGTAVGRLSIWGVIAISAYILVVLGWIPVAEGGLQTGLSLIISVLPAMIFVALFVRLLMREEEARNQAESLAQKLEAANQQLSANAAQAEELAITKERNRLAREIHDNLGHYLTVINVQLQAALAVLDDDRQKAVDSIETARNMTQDGLTAVRQSVSTLRESPLGDKPLTEAISQLAKETESAGIVVEVAIQGKVRWLVPATELTLFRAARKA